MNATAAFAINGRARPLFWLSTLPVENNEQVLLLLDHQSHVPTRQGLAYYNTGWTIAIPEVFETGQFWIKWLYKRSSNL